MLDRLLEDLGQVGRVGHGEAFDAVSCSHLGVVRAIEIHRVIALVIAEFLARLDPAEDGVGKDDHQERDLLADDRLQFADGEAEAAVTHDGNDLGGLAAVPCAHGADIE